MSSIPSTTTSSPPMNKSLGTLSLLPPELRNIIYDFLTPSADPTSPFSASRALAHRIGVGAVSHVPPPTALLLASTQLCDEVRDVYYRKMVVTIERTVDTYSPWTLLGVEETFGKGVGRSVLERVRRVRVEVFWHWVPGPVAVGMEMGAGGVVCARELEVAGRMERMERVVDVLSQAGELRFFNLEWREVAPLRIEGDEVDFEWEVEARKRVLGPLRRLRGLRRVECDVIAGERVEGEIRTALGEVRREIEERGGDVWSEGVVGGERRAGLTLEDKRILADLLMGEGQYLLTPEDRAMHPRKQSYFG